MLSRYNAQFEQEHGLREQFLWAGPNKSILATTLKDNKRGQEEFFIALGNASALKNSNGLKFTPTQMQFILSDSIGPALQTPEILIELIKHVPEALVFASKCVEEKTSLSVLTNAHCEFIADLPNQWNDAYPDGELADTINPLLSTMQTLDTYDASMLRVAVGLQEPQESAVLPDDAFQASM